MPSHYAHYRFGSECIPLLAPQEQRIVKQFRQLYDAGLQGPDIFFYRSIFLRDSAAALASATHKETGADFFTRCCQMLRQESGEAAQAYLLGLLAHYCLDKSLHPMILLHTQDGTIGHAEAETEFDRYLLQLDGHRQPNTYDMSSHVKLTPGECATVARFYPGTGQLSVLLSIRGMAMSMKILAMPNGGLRRFVEKGAGKRLRQHFMHRLSNRRCAHLNEPLLEHYRAALELLPEMAAQLREHLAREIPLGESFGTDFDG